MSSAGLRHDELHAPTLRARRLGLRTQHQAVAVMRTTYKPSSRLAGRSDPVVHRVRRGDTLSSIARRYNVLVNQLTKWNFIRASDILRLGQKLKIWPNGSPTALIETLSKS